jgi:hypothetical protein
MAQNAFGHLIPQQQAPVVQQQPTQDPIIRPVDPYKARDQAMQEEANRRANDAAARAAEAASRQAATSERTSTIGSIPSGYRLNAQGTLEKIPGGPGSDGKPLPDSAAKRIESGVGQFSQLAGALTGFKDEYAGNALTGNLENTVQGLYSGFGSEGQRNWWADFQGVDNVIRNELFGAALTPQEKASYERTTVDPSLDPKIVRENIGKRIEIIRGALDRQQRFMVANGYNPEAVAILYEPLAAMEALQGSKGKDKKDEPAPAMGNALQTGNIPGDASTPMVPQSGNTQTVTNTGVTSRYSELLAGGASGDELAAYLQSVGINDPKVLTQAKVQARYREQFPKVPISDYRIDFTQDLPVSAVDQAMNAVAQFGNETGIGAYAINAADALTAGTMDNITGAFGGNAERIRANLRGTQEQSPTASALGQISGGVLGAMTGEAALARAGMGAGIGRSVLADTAYGAASGAGNADNGDRLGNAMLGGLTAGAGSAVGNVGMNALARGLTPTGGGSEALYAAGVRPTIGQRGAAVADQGGIKGTVGRMVSGAEQKLQSVPIVGSAISGARQEARDQFQIGAFNEALKEVGETLPKGMKPGTAPNAYAQKTFNRIYAEARSGMNMVPDDELAQDLAALAPDLEILGPQATSKFKAVMDNVVNNRAAPTGGQLSGDLYKRTISDLDKKIALFSKGTTSEDRALAEAIGGVKSALEQAARRHSDPDSVALLDAADAGYAKLVRIEGAAARAGGDAGTFTPTGFDREVQKQAGTVRSKSFLRGDALMQDYAQQGKSLVDTVPNSGTVDRGIAAAGLAGSIALSPKAALLFGGLLGAYAPGTRKVMQSALSPAGPKRKAIAQQLEKRAQLVGRSTAASAAALSQGTGPDQ